MTTITKERIELFIKNPLENGLTRGEQMDLARIALVSLDAEPVRYLNKFSGTCVTLEQQSNAADDVAVYMPLYAAPPASEREQIRRKNEPVAYLVCNGHLYQDRPFLDLSTARKSVKDRNDGAEIKALCVCEISAEK